MSPLRTLSGETLDVAFTLAFPQDDDAYERALVTLTDVSAQTVARREREARIGEMERAVRFGEMLIGIVGHDLRNPLSAITTAAGLLQHRADSERIAWRDPVGGQLYVAHRYGREEIDGRTVERGIAARVLSWMNLLTQQAYEISAENPDTGELTVARYADDSSCPEGKSVCAGQPIEKSREYTLRTKNYKSVLDFMRQVTATYGFYDPAWRGLYQ